MGAIIDVVRSLDCVWVLAGDFNLEPDEFAAGYWAMASGGVIVAPTPLLGTCRSVTAEGVTANIYDYFLVDPRLREHIQAVEVMEDFPSAPHKPVRLCLATTLPTSLPPLW